MEIRLTAKPEEIAEIETKKAIRIYWNDIMNGQDINPPVHEWLELVEDEYVRITDDEKYFSGTAETRAYEFIKQIAQLCRARMTTKLIKISEAISSLKCEFTE